MTQTARSRALACLRIATASFLRPSSSRLFVDKVRDIVRLHLNPQDRALVLCVAEKSPISKRSIERNPAPAKCGRASQDGAPTTTSGTVLPRCSLRSKSPPATVIGECPRRHSPVEYVHLILNNQANCKTRARMARRPSALPPAIKRWVAHQRVDSTRGASEHRAIRKRDCPLPG